MTTYTSEAEYKAALKEEARMSTIRMKKIMEDRKAVLPNAPNSLLNKLLVKIRNKHRGMRKAMKEGSVLLYPFRLIKLVLFWILAFIPVWYLSAFLIVGDMFRQHGGAAFLPALIMFLFMMSFPIQLGIASVNYLYRSSGDIAAWYDRYSAIFANIWTGLVG